VSSPMAVYDRVLKIGHGSRAARARLNLRRIKHSIRSPINVPGELTVTDVSIDAEHVVIQWGDGMTCRYPFRYLRLQCGCAGCGEEMTGRAILAPVSVPDDILILDQLLVGRYAMQFMFTDGHTTGIYPLKDLRKMSQFDAVQCEGPGRRGI